MREKPTNLSDLEIKNLLNTYKEWELDTKDGIPFFKMEKEFRNFTEAFSFITKVALVSESIDHHAEIWNVYNKLRLQLFTHETNSVTTRDKDFITRLMD
ncbi:4a-hydroxytetrahydrobiopterin dehydratase [Leptospira meyeri]|uniref:4a-hydroxytetrahydrobiopterin dehydratase n=1 Tax=Leptospira meyeri TaxID=29508 RepID=UPI000C2B19F8|nr:4a-hydroxytetrahydrobiopterin dehydratase [Leptospira meyeri]PKA25009.1 4a-hydroxytetrahydrobiopterin dehydratase [Leptospira sp. mixed culture ATI2-C-A1]PJZ81986.1 4a-hydroxytetrahydrobiopterin dehydratase [Leptospira meyeri]PJZ97490.1 4a-hydroxytetrahydrobiopterin dehydratase [Leptospira meyeri]PKA11745.1 4a-hydroxytetrahydrobiopterin dehydratase [Leptospira meyeri]TGM24002.1 4a-hydroxytetrahydrobiopterin dehydratase [Leptospira meyeri]